MSNLVKHQGFAPQTMTEAIDFSNMLSKSTMVPKAYQNKPEDVLVAVQWGYELGLAPLQALQNIATINGKPSVYGDAAMALVQNSPVCEDVKEYFEGEGTSNPIAVCVAKRKNRTEVISKYSVEDAKRAGLWNKQGPWTQYPKRMLQMRARGFALRDAFPDVLKGLITVEEAQDYPDDTAAPQAPQIKHANPLDAIPSVSVSEVEVLETPAAECSENTTLISKDPCPMDALDERIDESVSDQIQPPGTFKLNIPGKPSELHEGMTAWMDRYNEMADKVARSRLAKELKIQKIGEFNTLNADVLKMLTAVQQAGMAAHKQKRKAAIEAN